MAFTLTKIRDTIITHVNKQADKIQAFKEDSINKLVTYDCLKVSIATKAQCLFDDKNDLFEIYQFNPNKYFRISWGPNIG